MVPLLDRSGGGCRWLGAPLVSVVKNRQKNKRLALEYRPGENGGLVARARRPAGWISALAFHKRHLAVSWLWLCIQGRARPWIADAKKPGAVSRPGTNRQFQFHE
jgi:hypothetical protein